jgi:hypothetical protein
MVANPVDGPGKSDELLASPHDLTFKGVFRLRNTPFSFVKLHGCHSGLKASAYLNETDFYG